MRASTDGNGGADSAPASFGEGCGVVRDASPSRTPAAPASTNKPTATATVSRFTGGVYRLCSREPEEDDVPETSTPKTELLIDGKTMELPVVIGTENERAIDIGKLRAQTGLVTLDPAFMNTASTKSAITFLDGEKGILRYRGYPIEQIAEQSRFVETSYLLIYGELPTKSELDRFSTNL